MGTQMGMSVSKSSYELLGVIALGRSLFKRPLGNTLSFPIIVCNHTMSCLCLASLACEASFSR